MQTNPFRALFSSFEPLRQRNFAIYLGGQAISLIGTWLQSTAQAWVVWELTGSEASLGIVASLTTLPLLVLGPFAGTIADRMDRRKLLIFTQFIAMLLAFTLAILVSMQVVQLWHVYLLALGLGIVSALDFPAQQAFLGDLSGMELVRKAVNLNAMFLQVSRIIGPAFAGFIIATFGSATTFWLNGLSFIPVIASLMIVRASQVRTTGRGNPLRDFGSAIQFVRGQPRMQDMLVLTILVTFFGLSVLNIMPAFATEALGGDAQTLGLMLAASGVGALISVLFVLPLIQTTKRTGLALAASAAWMGFWIFATSQTRSLPLAMIGIGLGSIGAPAVIATSLGITQLMAPPDMRARLVSLFIMVSFGMQPIASLYVGYTAQYFGVPMTIMFNGILLFSGALLVLLLRAPMRTWSALPQPAPAVE